jgi:hypothetical protein
MSDSKGGNPLAGAIAELHRQSPIKYDDLGPHHGTLGNVKKTPRGGSKGGNPVESGGEYKKL